MPHLLLILKLTLKNAELDYFKLSKAVFNADLNYFLNKKNPAFYYVYVKTLKTKLG